VGSEPLSADGHAATAAMLAVLSHQDVARRVDERLFEALLAYTLNSVPGLPGDLFGITASNFGFGKRPSNPTWSGTTVRTPPSALRSRSTPSSAFLVGDASWITMPMVFLLPASSSSLLMRESPV
jgi:hypothetical protein